MTNALLIIDSLLSALAWLTTARGNAGLGKLLTRGHNALATLIVAKGGEKNVGSLPGSDGGSGSGSVSG